MLEVKDGQTVQFKNGMFIVDGRQFPYGDGVEFADGAIVTCEAVRMAASESGAIFSGRAAVLAPRISGWTKMQIEALRDRDAVGERMFQLRFSKPSLARSYEGMLLAEAREVSAIYKSVFGPSFSRDITSEWSSIDDANFRLSIANNTLYSLLFPRLAVMGMIMQAGFLHRADPLSLLYDVADLYKVQITLSIASEMDGRDAGAVKSAVCEKWLSLRMNERIAPDLGKVLAP